MSGNATIMDKFRLDGRTAIVTGGAGLLGESFCRALAEAGARVVIAELDRGGAERVAGDLAGRGAKAVAIETDITKPDSVAHLLRSTVQAFGGVDILVNSAAKDPKFDPAHAEQASGAFETFPLEAWDSALQVNLTGAFLCAQAVAPVMVAAGGGAIINLCSTYGLVGPDQRIYERPGRPAQYKPVYYSVTKAGILGLTRYLAAYYAGKGIRVNALTPGGVFNQHDETFVRNYSSRTLLGRMAQQDELSGALLFLASDASSYMTGANLIVDGGWTAW